MMGLSEIRRVNLEASRKARRTKPRLISSIQDVEDIFEQLRLRLSNLSAFVPGKRRTDGDSDVGDRRLEP